MEREPHTDATLVARALLKSEELKLPDGGSSHRRQNITETREGEMGTIVKSQFKV
jgi:hypothetical protein